MFEEAAAVFNTLMGRLGHKKFIAQVPLMLLHHHHHNHHNHHNHYDHQGGDWGSLITTNLATLFPESVLGLHLNLPSVSDAFRKITMDSGSQLNLLQNCN